MNRRFLPSLAFLTSLTIAVASGRLGQSQVTTMDKESDLLGVLKSDSPPADKAIACKRLAIYGSAEAAPELAKLLTNEQLAAWARIALEAIPGAKVDEALRKASESLQGRLLIGTINSIGVRRDVGAVDALLTRLKDKDTDVASAAAVALGRIGNSVATEALRKAIVNSPEKVRSAVAEGCVLCAERSMRDGNAVLAATVYDEIRNADVPLQRSVEATRGAILAKKQNGLPLLLETLRSPEKALFQVALKTAREMSGREVDNAMAIELVKTPEERAAVLIQTMADRKETVVLPAILKASETGPKSVRLSAIQALGRVGNATCVTPLVAIAAGEDDELADAALSALADVPDPSVNADIVSRLPKSQGKILSTLIAVVGERRIEATQELVKALNSSDTTVHAAALKSLGATVPAESLWVLIAQVVQPTIPEDLEAAQQALKTAAVRMPDREACATQIATAMEKSSATTKSVMLDVLGAVGGTKALDAMKAAAKSEDPHLRDTSSRVLGEWLTIDAAPVLLDLVKTGPADKFQSRLFKGYLRMAKQFAKDQRERSVMCANAFDAARQPAEQKLVLELLKQFPDVEMLKIAIKALKVEELKADATQTALAIAEKSKGNAEEIQKLLAEAGLAVAKK